MSGVSSHGIAPLGAARFQGREDDARPLPTSIAALVASDAVSGPGRQLTALARAVAGVGIGFRVVVFHRPGRPPSAFARYLDEAGVEHVVVEDRGPLDWRPASRGGPAPERWQPRNGQAPGLYGTAGPCLV